MAKPVIIFDLDGTIIDVYERYYSVLCDYLHSIGRDTALLTLKDYIRLKKELGKDHLIVNKVLNVNLDINEYVLFKSFFLEDAAYLKKDKLIGDVPYRISVLKRRGFKVILLTQRKNRNALFNQLSDFGIETLFDSVIVPDMGEEGKLNWIRDNLHETFCIIGDSRNDMICSKLNGAVAFFVDSGLHSYKNAGNIGKYCVDYEDAISYILKSYSKEKVNEERTYFEN